VPIFKKLFPPTLLLGAALLTMPPPAAQIASFPEVNNLHNRGNKLDAGFML